MESDGVTLRPFPSNPPPPRFVIVIQIYNIVSPTRRCPFSLLPLILSLPYSPPRPFSYVLISSISLSSLLLYSYSRHILILSENRLLKISSLSFIFSIAFTSSIQISALSLLSSSSYNHYPTHYKYTLYSIFPFFLLIISILYLMSYIYSHHSLCYPLYHNSIII